MGIHIYSSQHSEDWGRRIRFWIHPGTNIQWHCFRQNNNKSRPYRALKACLPYFPSSNAIVSVIPCQCCSGSSCLQFVSLKVYGSWIISLSWILWNLQQCPLLYPFFYFCFVNYADYTSSYSMGSHFLYFWHM